MKHFNKQLEVNLDFFDKEDSNPKRKAFMEGINITILIILGCGGLYLCSNLLLPKDPQNNFSKITANASAISNGTKKAKSNPQNTIQKEQLIIKGHREAGEKITLTVDGFNKKAKYRIDFGDDTRQTVTSKEVSHTYNKPGNYNILLTIGYQNEPVQRVSKKIYIDQPIEVMSEAYQEK